MTKILIVDDDVVLSKTLAGVFAREGYDTLVANNGVRGLELARSAQPDLIILEVQIPELDGFSICRIVRFERDTPIMFLTTRQAEADRMLGLDLGADDYVVKPYHLGELLARVRAHLRRSSRPAQTTQCEMLVLGDLQVDTGRRRVFQSDAEIELVPKEFDLLVCLMRNSGLALSRDVLLQQVWGDDFKHDPRTVDVHIRYLRTKIEANPARPHYIQTVRGSGYRFVEGVRTRLVNNAVPEQAPGRASAQAPSIQA